VTQPFLLTLWTNDPRIARNADRAGVDRIGLDLETLGKAARQRGAETWISPHDISQLPAIKQSIKNAALYVRCNPLNPGSKPEIERLIDHGVDVIMLPNFETASEVEQMLRLVDGRATVVPLVERLRALQEIEALARMGEIKEIHIGLNDLSIDLGYPNRFMILDADLLDGVSRRARALGLGFSVGGIGRALDANLPVPSDLFYAQHARLGSGGALIAASFRAAALDEAAFAAEIRKLRMRVDYWRGAPEEELARARLAFQSRVADLVTTCSVSA